MLPYGLLISLLGLLFCPIFHQIFRQSIVAGYVIGWILTAVGTALILLDLALRLRHLRWHGLAPGLRDKARLSLLTVLSLYLVAEAAATAIVLATGQREAMIAFRDRELLRAEPEYAPHPFLGYTRHPDRPDVNRLGFDGPDWPIEATSGTIRIAFAGGLASQGDYPAMTRDLLARRVEDFDFETLNFGMTGWTSLLTLISYDLHLRHYRPPYLVLHVGPDEFRVLGYRDFRRDYAHAFRPATPPPPPRDYLLTRYLNSYALVNRLVQHWIGEPDVPPLPDLVLRPATRHFDLLTDIEPLLDAMRANVELIVGQARLDGTRVVLTTIPFSRTNLSWSPAFPIFMGRANDVVREVAASTGSPLVDFDRRLEGEESLFLGPVALAPEAMQLQADMLATVLQRDLMTSGSAALALPGTANDNSEPIPDMTLTVGKPSESGG